MPLSYDARSVFSLFSMKYMGSCPLNREKIYHEKLQEKNVPSQWRKTYCKNMSLLYLSVVDTDSEPAFYLNTNPDRGSQTNADPDPGQTLPSQKVEFLHKKK